MRPDRRAAVVSGIAKTTPAKVTRPRATSITKIDRQPNHAPRNPPTAGPTPGARLWTMVSNAMREVASPRPALSRTIARPNTNPPQPPTACRTPAPVPPPPPAPPPTPPPPPHRLRDAHDQKSPNSRAPAGDCARRDVQDQG